MTAVTGLVRDALGRTSAMAALRAALTDHPETGLHTPHTQAQILAALAALPIDTVTPGIGLSSITAVIQGARPGRTVLLRTGTDTADPSADSRHDLHAAALYGAAALLADRRHDLTGSVVLAWQPGTGHGGAARMLAEGLLSAAGNPVAACYTLRILAGMPHGVIATRPGPMSAGNDRIRITLTDTDPGAAALTRSPAAVACDLAALLDRARLDTADPVLVTVDQVTATTSPHTAPGSQARPDTATITATVRTQAPATMGRITDAITRLARARALGHRMHAETEVVPGHPTVVNDPTETDWITRTVGEMFGPERLCPLPAPVALADDAGHLHAQVPGALALLLGSIPDGGDARDGLVPTAAAFLAGLALRRLATPTTAARVPDQTRRANRPHHLTVVS
jgi:hippurate hydrolase